MGATVFSLSKAHMATESGWPFSMMLSTHPFEIAGSDVTMRVDHMGYHVAFLLLPSETGLAPLPAGAQPTTEFDVYALYISAHTAAPQACWDWISYLSERSEVVMLLPAWQSVVASQGWQANAGDAALPADQATLAYGDKSVFRTNGEVPWLAYTYPWLDTAYPAVVAGQDAATALATAQAQAEALIACVLAESDFAD
jgi:ABC-type glycerol-3-phosphate transport system substrate-binding protein